MSGHRRNVLSYEDRKDSTDASHSSSYKGSSRRSRSPPASRGTYESSRYDRRKDDYERGYSSRYSRDRGYERDSRRSRDSERRDDRDRDRGRDRERRDDRDRRDDHRDRDRDRREDRDRDRDSYRKDEWDRRDRRSRESVKYRDLDDQDSSKGQPPANLPSKPRSKSKSPEPQETASKDETDNNEEEEEDLMAKMMGFSSFNTTKDKKVAGTNVGSVSRPKASSFRQYM